MRDFYRYLIAVFTAPDLRWQTPVKAGVAVALVVGIALPVLLPWTGFFALALETLAVVAGVGGGLALIGYGGWLLIFGNRMQRFALEEVDDDEDMAIEAEAVEEAEVVPESPGRKSADADRKPAPRRPVGQIGGVCPICPRCRGPMTRGRAKAGRAKGRDFWVCQKYPDCRGLRAIIGGRRRG